MARRLTLERRACGVLLHPSSLPGPHGSGDLGPQAHAFARFLRDAGQTWWQMLPICPADAGGSPYSSDSAFAGDPLLINLDALIRDGLLTDADSRPGRGLRADRISFAAVARFRRARLARACDAFLSRRLPVAFRRFCERNAHWLEDFALFRALKDAHGGRTWLQWPRAIRLRRSAALRDARQALAGAIDREQALQFLFDRQWHALRETCRALGVGLIGDLPIFVCHDSADVWAQRELYRLDAAGRPRVVSGVPPDYFSKTGQLWGHPLYDWRRHARDGFAWWIARFRTMFERFDAVRIDHFLGFNRCWAVPGRAKTAMRGVWTPSPGYELFAAVRAALGKPEIIAEDLGLLTPAAAALRDELGFPGIRLLQFAFGDGARYDQPHNYPRRCVAYPGTHDNETAVGWFRNVSRDRRRGRDGWTTRERALRYLPSEGREIHWDMIRALYASPSDTVIVPLQDVLGLDNRARMNTPATTKGNWRWRITAPLGGGEFGRASAALRGLALTYERAELSPQLE